MSDIAATSPKPRFFSAPGVALGVYALLLAAGGAGLWNAWSDLADRSAEVVATEEQAARLRGRGLEDKRPISEVLGLAPGAAFLGGDKETVAAAELQKRVNDAVAAAGGTVASSQIDRGETKDGAANIALLVESEIDQPGLQKLLYTLESTTPFLFVDKLSARVRNDAGNGRAPAQPKLRVGFRVSAVWRSSGK